MKTKFPIANLIKKTIAVWCALLSATSFSLVKAKPLLATSQSQQSDLYILSEIENYINNIKCLSVAFTETSSQEGDSNKGHIYIKRECIDGKTAVRINYETGKILSVRMNGRFLTITERETNKSRTYSILTTPMYAILAGKLDFKSLKRDVIENTQQQVTVQILYEKQTVNLTFQKTNDTITKLLSWNVKNGTEWASIELDKKKYFENDLSKIPEETFQQK